MLRKVNSIFFLGILCEILVLAGFSCVQCLLVEKKRMVLEVTSSNLNLKCECTFEI